MYKKILVPLDGSQWSEAVLPYAGLIGGALGVPMELLQIIHPELVTAYSDPDHGRYVDVVSATLKNETVNYLKQTARPYATAAEVQCDAEIGNPADAIIDRAAAVPDALIAMSTHGRSGIERWLMGSIAHKVLHAAANPLLLVRPGGAGRSSSPASFEKVLVPLDGSPLGEHTLPHVRALSKSLDLEVVLIRAYEPLAQGHVPFAERVKNEMREEVEGYLKATAKDLEGAGVRRVSYLCPVGNAAETIVDITRGTPHNLVIICTHGRSGIGRWVLGSVTDQVVRHCGSPVLVIRAPR